MSVLDQLYRLQERFRFVESQQRARDTIPPEFVEVDRDYREKVETLERIQARLAVADKEWRRADAELSDLKEKQKKYQTQLRNVQSSREYSAVLNEIDGVERSIRATEDNVLELEEEIEVARKDAAERQRNLPAETEAHEERLKDWRAAQRAIDDDLASAREEITRIEAEMGPREQSEFRRLFEKKAGLAVVRVAAGSCSACHVKIRPAALQVLKAGREITYCDSCKRILYYDHQAS